MASERAEDPEYARVAWHNCVVLVWASRTFIYDPAYPHRNQRAENAQKRGMPAITDYYLLGTVFQLLTDMKQAKRAATCLSHGNIYLGGGGNFGTLPDCRDFCVRWMTDIALLIDRYNGLTREMVDERAALKEGIEWLLSQSWIGVRLG